VRGSRLRAAAIGLAIGLAVCAVVIALLVRGTPLWLVWTLAAGCIVGIAPAIFKYRHDLLAVSGISDPRRLPGRDFIVPIELPPPPRYFEGRARELKSIHEKATSVAADHPVVIVITGPPGIGKTALATRYASLHRHLFPDGQIFAQLEHSDGSNPPAYDILGRFINALQFPDDPVAEEAAARSAQYASLTADRRLLVIIDNACHSSCVTSLLPSGPKCVAIVTSRMALTELPAALRIPLDPLSEREGIRLLESVVGPGRVGSDSQAAGQLAGTGHPLAIRLAATALTRRPYGPLDLALTRMPGRATPVSATAETAVSSNLDLIYTLLTKEERRVLRCVALLERPVFKAWELAALLGTQETDAVRLADNLARLGLVRRTSGGRAGIVEFSVDEHILPYLHQRMYTETSAGGRRERLDALTRARSARVEPETDIVRRLNQAVSEWKDSGRFAIAFGTARDALESAHESGQRWIEALALATIADLRLEIGNIAGARELAEAAVQLADGTGPARALRCLGRIMCQEGQPEAAQEFLDRALAEARRADDAAEEISALMELASALAMTANESRSIAIADLAVASCRSRPDCAPLLAAALYARAKALLFCSHAREARACLDEAVLAASDDRPLRRAWIDWLYGRASLKLDDHRAAIGASSEAIESFGAMSHRYGVACSRLLLGAAYATNDDQLAESIASVSDALETLQNCGDPYTESEAKHLLGSLLGRKARAGRDARDLEEAAKIFEDLDDDASLRALQEDFALGRRPAAARWWQPGSGKPHQPSVSERASSP
jgi:tetratricopeptide (TPR) repeat protein